jgi:hypothetical protein
MHHGRNIRLEIVNGDDDILDEYISRADEQSGE